MRQQDLSRFQTIMASLAEVFSKQLSPAINTLYWDTLQNVFIEELQQAAKTWLKTGKHFPKPAELLECIPKIAPAKVEFKLPAEDGEWLKLVNGMFLRYLSRRRLSEGFKGDIDIAKRREECLSLAKFFEDIEAEGDEEATELQMQVRFDRAMERISDLSTSKDWLDAQLEHRRKA